MIKAAAVIFNLMYVGLLFPVGSSVSGRTGEEIMQKAEAVIQERVDRHNGRFGIVLGIVDHTGSRIVAYGRAKTDTRVDKDSIFNIGSVAKLFTATLLADMVERGEVGLDDEIDRFLPPGVKTPSRKGRKITLLDLATHTSGLPSTPGNSTPSADGRPGYCDYSEKQLVEFMSGYRLTRDIGSSYHYSNLGMGLLGFLLSRRSEKSLDDLLGERIWQPLKMPHTGSREKISKLYAGDMTVSYHDSGVAAPNWPMSPVLKGAGGYYSSVPDMLRFLAAHMGLIQSPLLKAMRRTQQGYRSTGSPGGEVGLGWGISTNETEHYLTHSGGSEAYSSFVGIDKKRGRGVVILGNSYFEVIDIGIAVLTDRLEMPGKRESAAHREYKPRPGQRAAWNDFAGLYQMSPGANAMVSIEGGRMLLQLPRQPGLTLSATGEASFISQEAELDVLVWFRRNDQGKVAGLEISHGAVKAELEKIPKPKTVPVSGIILDACTGLFDFEEDLRLEITREKDALYAQATMQPKVRIFAATESEFFSMLDDMRITFIQDEKGGRNELVYRHQGRERRGKRVKEKATAEVDPAGFGDYVGRYRVTPRFVLTVTTENGRIFAQGSFQPVFELIPEGKDSFYIKTVDAKVRFIRDPGGRVTQIVVSTASGDETGNRIEP